MLIFFFCLSCRLCNVETHIVIEMLLLRLTPFARSPFTSDLLRRQRRPELADLLLDRTGRHLGQEGRLGHPCRQPQELLGSRVQDDSGGDGRRERRVQRRTSKQLANFKAVSHRLALRLVFADTRHVEILCLVCRCLTMRSRTSREEQPAGSTPWRITSMLLGKHKDVAIFLFKVTSNFYRLYVKKKIQFNYIKLQLFFS